MKIGKETRLRLIAFMLIVFLTTIGVLTSCVSGGEIDSPMNKSSTNSPVETGSLTPTTGTGDNKVKETTYNAANSNNIKSTDNPGTEPSKDIIGANQNNTAKEPEVISITISAVGDCTLGTNYKMSYENSFDEVYDRKGKSYFFKNVYEILSKDDFTIANL